MMKEAEISSISDICVRACVSHASWRGGGRGGGGGARVKERRQYCPPRDQQLTKAVGGGGGGGRARRLLPSSAVFSKHAPGDCGLCLPTHELAHLQTCVRACERER